MIAVRFRDGSVIVVADASAKMFLGAINRWLDTRPPATG